MITKISKKSQKHILKLYKDDEFNRSNGLKIMSIRMFQNNK